MVGIRHVVTAQAYDLNELDQSVIGNDRIYTTQMWFDDRPDLKNAIHDRLFNKQYPVETVLRFLRDKCEYPYRISAFKRYVQEARGGHVK